MSIVETAIYIKYSLSIQCILFHRRSSFLLFSDATIIILYIKIINLLTKTLRRSFSFSIFYKLSTYRSLRSRSVGLLLLVPAKETAAMIYGRLLVRYSRMPSRRRYA